MERSDLSDHTLKGLMRCMIERTFVIRLRLGLISLFQDLCKKLLEVVGVAPVEIQREVITAIPEILDDAQHDDAAMALKYVTACLGFTDSCTYVFEIVGKRKKKCFYELGLDC